KECIAPTIDTCQGGYREPSIVEEPKVAVKEATKKGYAIATVGDSINIAFPNSTTRRGRVGEGVAQTLETGCNQATLESDYKIRKLTPLECWRLMNFNDEDYWKARKALEETYYNGGDRSNSQMYKMAGNSIVVNVLVEIYKNLFEEYIIKQI
ncbi:MAG TPA: DNA cytosine methyltransferase, partial [Tissierellaceae bacterium]|nr:DNA cytosine methyltransferase [Tissierellaceae bacterium]